MDIDKYEYFIKERPMMTNMSKSNLIQDFIDVANIKRDLISKHISRKKKKKYNDIIFFFQL